MRGVKGGGRGEEGEERREGEEGVREGPRWAHGSGVRRRARNIRGHPEGIIRFTSGCSSPRSSRPFGQFGPKPRTCRLGTVAWKGRVCRHILCCLGSRCPTSPLCGTGGGSRNRGAVARRSSPGSSRRRVTRRIHSQLTPTRLALVLTISAACRERLRGWGARAWLRLFSSRLRAAGAAALDLPELRTHAWTFETTPNATSLGPSAFSHHLPLAANPSLPPLTCP